MKRIFLIYTATLCLLLSTAVLGVENTYAGLIYGDEGTLGYTAGNLIETVSDNQVVLLPDSDRDPSRYAYDSEMSPDGWYMVPRVDDVSANTAVHKLKARAGQGPGSDPGFDPDNFITISRAQEDVIELTVRCDNTATLYRKVENGSMLQIGTVDCNNALHFDYNVTIGVRYCYAIRPLLTDNFSNEACYRIPYEPFKFHTRANSHTASEDMIKRFDWLKTDPIYAGIRSNPTLWYMNILADSEYDIQGLRAIGIHTQTTPLFPQEQNVWHGDNDIVEVDGKLVGRWIYALVPGAVYNDIRQQMIERIDAGEEPSFKALVFRHIPVSTARVWASIHRPSPIMPEYVGQMGLNYNGYSPCQIVDGESVCWIQSELLGWLGRKVYDIVVDFIDNTIEGVRQVIGRVARLIKGDVTLTLRFILRNTDSFFGTSNEVISAWINGPLVLKNTRVQLSQGLALFKGNTDQDGIARIKVAKGWSGKICLELENNHVSFTGGWAESMACVDNFSATNTSMGKDVLVNHELVNAFATMTDAAEYVETVMNYNMPRVKVLVGWAAERSGGDAGESFAPCLGMAPVLVSAVLDLGLSVIPVAHVAAALAEAFYSVDIILKDEDLGKRSVAVHEYGHTVMCSMMRRANITSADFALLDILKGYMFGDRKDPAKEQTYLTEALADFLTLQVVGGTNYVSPNLSPSSDYTTAGGTDFCHAGSDCYETDYTAADDNWSNKLRRAVSILQDVFDNNDISGETMVPNDGSHWVNVGGILQSSIGLDSNNNDEPFELPGRDMKEIYERWANRGNTLREASFFGGLGELLIESNYSPSEVCDMFAAHDIGGNCPDYIRNLDPDANPGGDGTPSPPDPCRMGNLNILNTSLDTRQRVCK